MKRSITVLSIISTVLSILALLITCAMLTFLWKPLCLKNYGYESVIEIGPVIPIGNMIYLFGCFGVALFLLMTLKSNKNIAIEIISITFVSALFPILNYYIPMVQYDLVGNNFGSDVLAALSVTTSMLSLPIGIMEFSSSLCLITSGMRIADKINLKNNIKTDELQIGN